MRSSNVRSLQIYIYLCILLDLHSFDIFETHCVLYLVDFCVVVTGRQVFYYFFFITELKNCSKDFIEAQELFKDLIGIINEVMEEVKIRKRMSTLPIKLFGQPKRIQDKRGCVKASENCVYICLLGKLTIIVFSSRFSFTARYTSVYRPITTQQSTI